MNTKKLSEICKVIRGASPRPKGDPKYFGGTIPWIKISDLTKSDGKYLEKTKEFLTEEGKKKSVYLESNTLILTNSATVGLPKITKMGACIHDGFLAFLDISSEVLQDYLYYYFLAFRSHISELAPHGTQKNLNTPIIKSLEITIPSIIDQKKIIQKLDTVTQLSEKGFSSLFQINSLLDSYFEDLFGNDKSRNTKKLREIILEFQPGFAYGKFNSKSGIPHLRPFNVSKNGFLTLEKIKYVPKNVIRKNLFLKNGDILFNNTNSEELVGKTALIDIDEKLSFSNHMTKISADNSFIKPEYLWMILKRNFDDGTYQSMSKRWVNQTAIEKDRLLDIDIFLPNIDKQRKFCQFYQEIMKIKKLINERNDKINHLIDTVLTMTYL